MHLYFTPLTYHYRELCAVLLLCGLVPSHALVWAHLQKLQHDDLNSDQ